MCSVRAIGRSGNVLCAGDRAIGKCAQRANSSCNSVNFTRYPKLGHGRNSDTAVPFPYELGGGYMRLCAKKFGHGAVPFPYKSGGDDVLDRAIDYFGVAPRNSDTAVPFPYKSGDGDVLCAGERLFWGRETALPCPLLPPSGDRHFGVGKRHCRVLFCLHRAIDILG